MGMFDTSHAVKANRQFIKRTMSADLLEAQHELDLATAWRERGDQKALHELTSAYFRLVVAVAARFKNYGLPMGDLIQEGVVGLMQAAQRFEPERKLRFSTYATWWIRAAVQDYVLRNWSIVRLTSTATQKTLFFNLRRLKAKIAGNPSKDLSREGALKIAAALRVPVNDVQDMDARLTSGDRSLNAAPGEPGEMEWQDLLTDERARPDEHVMLTRDSATRAAWINLALNTLTPREQVIVRERQMQDEAVTLEALGERLGISKERVRQIEASALGKLKKVLLERVGDPVEAGLIAA
ncbi:MAG: RNA polymerase factor sigma-32 [Alphaproteobacteria bacterium]|nr:RNA polymerase factor sigma-32 [Alphaproteobacteria bacterium]